MKVLKEVTEDWDVDYKLPNHTYLLDGDKVIAYKPWHEDPIQRLKGKYSLDRRYRKFVELEFVPAEWDIEAPKSKLIVVQGSKGNTYEVDPDAGTCTCPGFSFRGACKHVKELEAA